jgi:predicted dinucleotide-binding enzyme
MENRQCVGVIGCGNMGFALARRLLLSSYNVLMGSRRPEHHRYDTLAAEIISIAECVRLSPVLFIAIHAEYYESILVSLMDKDLSLFDGKILIDLTNQMEKDQNVLMILSLMRNDFKQLYQMLMLLKHLIQFHHSFWRVQQQVNHDVSRLLVIIHRLKIK